MDTETLLFRKVAYQSVPVSRNVLGSLKSPSGDSRHYLYARTRALKNSFTKIIVDRFLNGSSNVAGNHRIVILIAPGFSFDLDEIDHLVTYDIRQSGPACPE
jgi:hypothetical protein